MTDTVITIDDAIACEHPDLVIGIENDLGHFI